METNNYTTITHENIFTDANSCSSQKSVYCKFAFFLTVQNNNTIKLFTKRCIINVYTKPNAFTWNASELLVDTGWVGVTCDEDDLPDTPSLQHQVSQNHISAVFGLHAYRTAHVLFACWVSCRSSNSLFL